MDTRKKIVITIQDASNAGKTITRRTAPKTVAVLPNAPCAPRTTPAITRAARHSRPLSKKPIREALGKARFPILIKPHTNHTQKPPEIKVHIPIKLAKFFLVSFLI
ncbi:uncharacterized protein LOC115034250 [Acyrthosiphon pisum]|uniref:Uncharacterized protein n=1 Tax=Acyrthosiphon pisum TaxID=7029 RepID=A0A8R2JTR2_ACYPI|nr:uncharacterized protein LOC115034250 [Acyrthosiphon pisum]